MRAAVIAAAVVLAACSSSGGGKPTDAAGPPAAIADLAATGDPSVVTLIRVEHRPYQDCARPSYYVTVPIGVQGRVLAADELAFLLARASVTGDCSAFLYGFRTVAESHQPGYTAGAVIYSGHLLEIHTGGLTSPPAFTFQT